MFTIVKAQLVFSLFLTNISQLTSFSPFEGRTYQVIPGVPEIAHSRVGTFVKNAAKNDKAFRCLNSLFYIAYGEEHAWDFIKGRNPDDFIHTSKAKEMGAKVQTMANSIKAPVIFFGNDYCKKHHRGNWKCIDCAKNLYSQVGQQLLQSAYLGPLKYSSGATYVHKDCAQFKKLHFGTCEILLAFLLDCSRFHNQTLLYQEKAKCFGYCEHWKESPAVYDSSKLFNACHNKTGIDTRIFRHGAKDLDYLRKFQADNTCRDAKNLPYSQ